MISKAIEFYKSQEWDVFWRLLTPIQKRILYQFRYRIGIRTSEFQIYNHKFVALPKAVIANYALVPVNNLGTNFSDFVKHGVLVADTDLVAGQTLYYLADEYLDRYIQGLAITEVFSRSELVESIASEVGKLVNQRLDALEQQGILKRSIKSSKEIANFASKVTNQHISI